MFRHIFKNHQVEYTFVRSLRMKQNFKVTSTESNNHLIETDDASVKNFKQSEEKPSILQPGDVDISHISTYLKPTFNFAAYINKSESLQELLKLGVNFHKLERNAEVPQFILGLNFETNMKPHIEFLHELGLELPEVGEVITKNPFIFKEELENLEVRINYLKSKKFDDAMILRIISKNPRWLSYTSQDIDKKLGFFQSFFNLKGSDVRMLATKSPQLITLDTRSIKVKHFVLKEELGFSNEDCTTILLAQPKIYMKNQHFLIKTFEYLNREMNIANETILEFPEILTCRFNRLRERHLFLQKLNKVQYNPKEPKYIPLSAFVYSSDSEFASEIANSSIQAFNQFLRTM